VAIANLVAARNVHHADGGKKLTKSSDSYKHVIALLQSVGVKITYNALMKRVSRSITEIRVTNTSESSVVSSLSPHGQGDNSLTSENTEKETTSHDDQSIETPELKSSAGGHPKEAQMPRRSKTREMNINVLNPLFWNTPENTTPLNLLEERWNMST
jgi:hypothetical protein